MDKTGKSLAGLTRPPPKHALAQPRYSEYFLLLALLFFGFAPPIALGTTATDIQQPRWEPLPLRSLAMKEQGIPGGEGCQYVYAIAYAPSNPRIAYFATDTSGVWRSDDNGESWTPKLGFRAKGARSLLVDPVDANVIFAAGFGGYIPAEGETHRNRLQGIFLSENGGDDWTLVRATAFYQQASKGCLFAFDSSTTKDNRTKTIFSGSYDEGLLQSDDGGLHWQQVGFLGHHIIDIRENPGRQGELYVATDKGLFLFRQGETKKIGTGLPDWPRSLSVTQDAPKIVFAAVGPYGLFKSEDNGRNFFSASVGLPKQNYSDVAVSPVDASVVYARADLSGLKPFYSKDSGRTWQRPVTTDQGRLLPDEGFYFSSPFAPHPLEAGTALHVSNGRARILKTRDGGKNWFFSGNGFTGGAMEDIAFLSEKTMLFALTDHGIRITEDGGASFRWLETKRVFGLMSSSAIAASGDTIVASIGSWTKKKILISRNLGKSWEQIDAATDQFRCIAFHPSQPNIIYAGPLRSLDTGKSWEKMAYPLWAMHPGDGNILYSLAVAENKVMVSLDRGEHWQPLTPPLPFSSKAITALAPSLDNPNRLYLSSDRGVLIFQDGQWTLRNERHGLSKDAFGMCYIKSIAVNPLDPGVIFAGRLAPSYGRSNGIFLSRDRGMTWQQANFNLAPGIDILTIKVSPFDGAVYLGTSYGTFRLSGSSPDPITPAIIDIRYLMMDRPNNILAKELPENHALYPHLFNYLFDYLRNSRPTEDERLSTSAP